MVFLLPELVLELTLWVKLFTEDITIIIFTEVVAVAVAVVAAAVVIKLFHSLCFYPLCLIHKIVVICLSK